VNAQLMTNERGRVQGDPEANIRTALRQGRISAAEVDRWRDFYARTDYETATKALLSRKTADFAAEEVRAAPLPPSEQAYRDFAIRCGIVKPTGGYVRSVC
jgi:hypothetical protein